MICIFLSSPPCDSCAQCQPFTTGARLSTTPRQAHTLLTPRAPLSAVEDAGGTPRIVSHRAAGKPHLRHPAALGRRPMRESRRLPKLCRAGKRRLTGRLARLAVA
jgi:hypothetical protein